MMILRRRVRSDSTFGGMKDANCWDALVGYAACAENAGISETLPDAEASHDIIAADFESSVARLGAINCQPSRRNHQCLCGFMLTNCQDRGSMVCRCECHPIYGMGNLTGFPAV